MIHDGKAFQCWGFLNEGSQKGHEAAVDFHEGSSDRVKILFCHDKDQIREFMQSFLKCTLEEFELVICMVASVKVCLS